MKVIKKDLEHALEIVKPGLSNTEVIEQASSFAFIGGSVVTYNDELSLSFAMKGLDIEGAIKAEELYQLLKKLKTEELEIEQDDTQLRIKAGRSKAGLVLEKEIKLPLEEIEGATKWKKIPQPDKFAKFLSFAMTGCSRDNSYPLLTCVHVTGAGIIEGTDSYKIVRCELGEKFPIKSILIPANLVREIVKIKPTHISKGANEGWIHFKSKDVVLACRIYDGGTDDREYPNVGEVLEQIDEKGALTFPKNITEVLDKAWVFAKRDDSLEESIQMDISGGKLSVNSKSDFGWFSEKLKVDYKGKISFPIIPSLLMGILKETRTALVGEQALLFEGGEGAWKYLTVLSDF
jgi:DNA polymerase III sliding clamp (beta) subunit (PCNA family)